MDRTHGGRVSSEGGDEAALANAMGDAMAEAAWPGIFAGGKQIVQTVQTTQSLGHQGVVDVLSFTFDDGSEMNIVGSFEVRYKERKLDRPLPLRPQADKRQAELDEGNPL